jgi:glycogen synthase
MKILIYSPLFHPSIGGLETVVSILAHEFAAQGHQVKLVCQVPATDAKVFSFEVIRCPHPWDLLTLTRWCDIYFQPAISLKGVWPLLIVPKPWVVAHHNWYTRPSGHISWQDSLKQFALRFATGISISQAIANHVKAPSTIISNPYQETIFQKLPGISRGKDLVFLGRLVSDKGIDLLLEALAQLRAQGLQPQLTIIGSGPEETNLRQQTQSLNLEQQVEFIGTKLEADLVQLLNTHRIMVIPSRWREPFGIVALEGIACGCVVIGSEEGGLKEAIGPCGVTFRNGDVAALTQALSDLLTHTDRQSRYREAAPAHLAQHRPAIIAAEYLQVFQAATP